MKEHPNYYANIPANVRYDNKLSSSEKLFYGEITALSSKTGECWASNSYFSTLYEVSPSTISSWVKKLEKAGYIDVRYEREGKQITKRILRIGGQNIDNPIQSGQKINRGVVNKSVEGNQNILGGLSENLQENNINSNNIKENIIKTNNTEAEFNKNIIEKTIIDILLDSEASIKDYNNAVEEFKELGGINSISEIMEWDDSVKENYYKQIKNVNSIRTNE